MDPKKFEDFFQGSKAQLQDAFKETEDADDFTTAIYLLLKHQELWFQKIEHSINNAHGLTRKQVRGDNQQRMQNILKELEKVKKELKELKEEN